MCNLFRSVCDWVGKSKILVSASVAMGFILIAGPANLLASSDVDAPDVNQDILTAVAQLYGINEDQAINRLVHESEAAITLKRLKGLSIKSYAGSWFDESSLRLKVAIADPNDVDYLELFDVDPVFVRNSLTDLRQKLDMAKNRLSSEPNLNPMKVSSYIDYKTNTAVLEVERIYSEAVRSKLVDPELPESIRVVETDDLPKISTGSVRGGDGIRNLSWQPNPGDVAPCSVGASVEDGFVTAGHCGFVNNSIGDSNNNSLGTVVGSEFDYDNPYIDAGYVETITGWTPTSQINGYTDGVFSVSDEWAGMIEYPVGTTVCRYGQTSGGPHCGTINQLNLDQEFRIGWHPVTGWITQITLDTTRVAGSCSDDGDSGGTWVGGTGQVQGVNIGGTVTNTCPITTTYTYYQPIKDVVDAFDVTMLTTHGSNAPDITDAECPDSGVSTYGRFYCEVTNVDSQGEVEFQWTSSNGGSSTKTWLVKRCTPPSTISVTLQATNPYGTDTKYYTFPCPTS